MRPDEHSFFSTDRYNTAHRRGAYRQSLIRLAAALGLKNSTCSGLSPWALDSCVTAEEVIHAVSFDD
jgi:hypothetical protein